MLGVFAKYSPEYPCLLNGLTRFNPMISEAFGADGDPALNLNITVSLPPRNPYVPGDQPQYADKSGPDCRGLTDIDAIIAAAQHGEYYCPDAAGRRRRLRRQPDDRQPELPGRQRPDDVPPGAGNPNAAAGSRCRSTWPARPQNWISCAASSRYQTGAQPDRSPTWPPPPWRRCCAGRR